MAVRASGEGRTVITTGEYEERREEEILLTNLWNCEALRAMIQNTPCVWGAESAASFGHSTWRDYQKRHYVEAARPTHGKLLLAHFDVQSRRGTRLYTHGRYCRYRLETTMARQIYKR